MTDFRRHLSFGWPIFSPTATRSIALVALGVACLPIVARAQSYSFVALGPTGASSSMAAGVSGGQVAGSEVNASTTLSNAVLWNGGTAASAKDLSPSTFSETFGTGISGTDTVGYGEGSATGYTTNALVWTGSTASTVVNLNPTSFTDSYAFGISGSTIVGYGDSSTTAGYEHALLWTGTTASSYHDLNPTGFVDSQAFATTGTNTVGYGEVSASKTSPQALLWTGTSNSAVNLNPTSFTSSEAVGIAGTMSVGYGVNSTGYEQALLWTGTSAATAVNLNPTTFTSTHAMSIGDGEIVGYGDGSATGGATHAIVWTGSTASSYLDLTTYLPTAFTNTYTNTFAVGVDANGNIVGYGQNLNNNTYMAFLLTPSTNMPEPGSLWLIAALGPGLAILRHKRSVRAE